MNKVYIVQENLQMYPDSYTINLKCFSSFEAAERYSEELRENLNSIPEDKRETEDYYKSFPIEEMEVE